MLPDSFNNEETLRLLNFLGGCRKVSDNEHIPNAESRYGQPVNIVRDQPVEVAVKITAAPLMTRDEFETERAKGQALYDAAHANENAQA